MRTAIFAAIIVLSMLFISATVWEGVTDVAAAQDQPGNYTVATNAFPKNSVVDITNLENGKMVRVIVASGLETTGLLATVSRNAAEALQLRDTFTCRIRMTLPPDDIAFARFRLGPIDTGNNEATAAEPETSSPYLAVAGDSAVTETADTYLPTDAERLNDTETASSPTDAELIASIIAATETDTEPVYAESVSASPPASAIEINVTVPMALVSTAPSDAEVTQSIAENSAPQASELTPVTAPPPVTKTGSGLMSIVPSTERIPSAPANVFMSPNDFASPIQPRQETAAPAIKPPLAKAPAAVSSPSEFSPFQVPLINRLEKGKWYVQVGVYTRADHVEDEVGRIGKGYPLAVQNVGSDANPLFRVLLGPLNQGESEAMLQRFKSIGYNDAFVRYN